MRIPVLLISLSLIAGLILGLTGATPACKQKRVETAKVWFDKGLREQTAGRVNEAIVSYSLAIKINDQYASAYNNRGNAYSEQNLYGLAISDYNKAIEIKPDGPDAYNNRGTAWECRGENKRAILDYSKAVELNPKCSVFLENRARLLLVLSNPSGAIQDCKHALRLNPKSANANSLLGLAYYCLRDYQQAIVAYTNAISCNPTDSVSLSNRGAAYWMLNRESAALQDLAESVRNCSSRPYAFWLRGKIFNKLEKYDLAITDLTWAIALEPQHLEAYKERRNSRQHIGDYQGACDDSQRAMKLRPFDPSLVTDTGVSTLQLATKQKSVLLFRKALSYFDRAIHLDKHCSYALFFRGITRLELGEVRDAIKDFDQSIKLSSYYGAYANRGMAKLKLGDKTGARQDFLEAVKLDPGNKLATKGLKGL